MEFVPTINQAFFMSIITMLGWGLWSTTRRKTGNWRFEAWYIDYIIGIVFTSFIIGLLLGGDFIESISKLPAEAIAWALFSGIVWGIGNLLLISAIRLAGFALAFPIGIGIALVLGTVLAYITNPTATSDPKSLFAGLIFVTLAIIFNGLAYSAKHAHHPVSNLRRGLITAIVCGVFIALFPFPFNFAFQNGMNGYNGAFFMTIGAAVVSTVLLVLLFRKPIVPKDKPIGFEEYLRASPQWHLWALLGGLIWSIAMVFNLVVANQPQFSVAIAYTLGQCAALVAALWGIFVEKEFTNAPRAAYLYLGAMFIFFIAGIVFIAQAAG